MDLTDQQLEKASHEVHEAMIAFEAAIEARQISMGMALVAMSKFIGIAIRRNTSALGEERRQQHVDGFSDIIRANAFDTGEDDEEEEKTT